MKTTAARAPRCLRRLQRGLTLVEMAIAMTVALFLLGGVMTILAGTKATFNTQNQLAQLQDNERIAMTMITDVIQAAGYYPSLPPVPEQYAAQFIAQAPFAAGQVVSGTSTAAGPDTISVRYVSLNDGVLTCQGGTNAGAAAVVYTNIFTIGAAAQQLQCQVNTGGAAGATLPLVSGVRNLVIWYGVNTGTAVDPTCADRYLRAVDVNALGLWGSICSVKVILTFANPATGQPVQFTRVIAVMNKVGANT